MNIRALTIVGGGSAYTPGLLLALLQHKEQHALERVVLYDIDEEHLDVVCRLGQAMAAADGAPFLVEKRTSLAEAVSGTDLVLNSARPGGLRCRRIDETLPLELGIPGQETVGPGGFFFALRSVPEALRLAATMKEVAPSALLFNYTNPTNVVSQALVDAGYDNVIALCDQSDEDLLLLGRSLGFGDVEHDALRFQCAGLNHATWYTDVSFAGRPLPPLAERKLAIADDLDDEKRLRLEVCDALSGLAPGFWPNSYLAYYTRPDLFVALLGRRPPRAEVIERSLASYYAHFVEEAAREAPELKHHRGTEGFGDLVVRALIALGAPERTRLVLNVQNRGITSQLDRATVVESVVEVSASGVHRTRAPDLPLGQETLIFALEEYQRRAAEAAAKGDRGAAVKALAANPLVPGKEVAERMLAAAQSRYGSALPMFA